MTKYCFTLFVLFFILVSTSAYSAEEYHSDTEYMNNLVHELDLMINSLEGHQSKKTGTVYFNVEALLEDLLKVRNGVAGQTEQVINFEWVNNPIRGDYQPGIIK